MFRLTPVGTGRCAEHDDQVAEAEARPSRPCRPEPPNACGMDSPMTRKPAMPTRSSSRSGVRDGVRALVSQA